MKSIIEYKGIYVKIKKIHKLSAKVVFLPPLFESEGASVNEQEDAYQYYRSPSFS